MKKHLVLAVAVVLVAVMVLALTGCGGDTDKAKDYIQKAEATADEFAGESEKMGASLETLMTELSTAISAGTLPDGAEFKASVDEIRSSIASIYKGLQKSKVEYEKVKTLKGVDDYVAFAEIRIQQVDASSMIFKEIAAYLDKTSAAIASGSADPASLGASMMDFGELMTDLTEQGDELNNKAEKLNEDKNLGIELK